MNRFKGLYLVNSLPEELWTEVHNIVQEEVNKTIPKKKQSKKAEWISEEALQIGEEQREVKSKGQREKYLQLNAEFQKLAITDTKAFFNEQCLIIDENSKRGKTRDLFRKIGNIKKAFHTKMGTIRDKNCRDLVNAEQINKRWNEYTEELYKKDLNKLDYNDGVVSHPELEILECKVKWALRSIAVNRVSGCDEIPAKLFRFLQKDAIKVLHSLCKQIWNTQQWVQDWKRSILIPIPKKGSTKECANHQTTALISQASKVILKIFHVRLQHYVSQELPDV